MVFFGRLSLRLYSPRPSPHYSSAPLAYACRTWTASQSPLQRVMHTTQRFLPYHKQMTTLLSHILNGVIWWQRICSCNDQLKMKGMHIYYTFFEPPICLIISFSVQKNFLTVISFAIRRNKIRRDPFYSGVMHTTQRFLPYHKQMTTLLSHILNGVIWWQHIYSCNDQLKLKGMQIYYTLFEPPNFLVISFSAQKFPRSCQLRHLAK